MNIPELENAAILETYNQLPITARERAGRHLLDKMKLLREEDRETLIPQIIGTAWLVFKKNYPNVILSEVIVASVSRYFIDSLHALWLFDHVVPDDMGSVQKCASLILNPDIVPLEYWGMLDGWPDTIYYHDLIRKDLQQMSLNHRYGKIWFINLPSSKSRLLKTI